MKKYKIIWRWRRVKRKAGSKVDYANHKTAARELAHQRITHFNAFYQFRVGKIAIRNQRTRWGSCSKKGNLNFNYKIAKLPPELSDYIIVHELCHLAEFNHSPAFWNLVAKTIPNYKQIKKKFKTLSIS